MGKMLRVNSPRRTQWSWRSEFVFLFLLLLPVSLAIVFPSATAQNPPQSNQQQRPRRVEQTPDKNGGSSATAPQPTPASSEEVNEGDVLRISTQLVTVPAVVTNKSGRPVPDLRANNFAVFEDGQPQKITNFATTEAPFEIALFLDTSGSTREELGLIQSAARAFISALRSGDRVAVVSFKTEQRRGQPVARVDLLSMLTGDRKALAKAIDNLGTSNGTPFYDGLGSIADRVFRDPPHEEVRGRRAVVALTDGVDSTSDSSYEEGSAKLLASGVACYFIEVNTEDYVEDRLLRDCAEGGLALSRQQLERYRRVFVPSAQKEDYQDFCALGRMERMQISRTLYNLARTEMNNLAKATGGKNFAAADLQEARGAFAQVANEIGTQYSLGYYPTNKSRDGAFRKIRVELRGADKDARVRAREGYYAPK